MTGSDRFVTMASGLVLPIEPLLLALDLEARGLTLGRDGDALTCGPRDRLTDADRQAIKRWRFHLLAIVAVEVMTA